MRDRAKDQHGLFPRAGALALICALFGPPPVWGAHGRADGVDIQPFDPSPIADLDALRDATVSDVSRQAAADRLVAQAENPTVRGELLGMLAEPLAGRGGASYIVRAIASSSTVTGRVYPGLAARVAAATEEELPALLSAVGSFRTRDAAGLLLRYAREEAAGDVAQAAFAALARLSARDDLGQDYARWEAWLAQCWKMSEAEWRGALVTALAARSDRLSREEQVYSQRMSDALRRVHLATPAAERSEFLATLLRDELPSIRALGFDLVARELSANHQLDGPVAAAALALLRHADPRTRANAAVLVNRLAPPDAEMAIADALVKETDPQAAAPLLDAAARWPGETIVQAALRWMTMQGPAQKSAAGALWAMYRAGVLPEDARRESLSLLRALPLESLAPAGCSLLAALGEPEDRDRLVPLLNDPSASVRLAVATAFLGFEEHAGDILAAAVSDPDLYACAARSTLLYRPTAEGYEALRSMPAPSPEARREGRLLASRGLPAIDLLTVAENTTDAVERRDLLEALVSESRVMSEGASPPRAAAIIRGALQLTRLHLAAQRADDALAALDTAAPLAGGEDRAAFDAAQTTALLMLGRTELAEKLDAPAAAWIEGLRRSLGRPQAAPIAEVISRRFAGKLTPGETADLARLRARIADAVPEGGK